MTKQQNEHVINWIRCQDASILRCTTTKQSKNTHSLRTMEKHTTTKSVPFKMQSNNDHELRPSTNIKSESRPSLYNMLSPFPRDTRVKVTLTARPLLKPTALKPCRCAHGVQNVCPFSNITSHRNRLQLFVKHLAMRIQTRKYRTRKQYTDW
jgi:hypothetical protein